MSNDTERHTEWVEQLSDYLDGSLTPDLHAEVEAHLAECGTCRRVLEDLQSVVTKAAGLDAIQPPRDLWAGIAATIHAPAPRSAEQAKVIAFPAGRPTDDVAETRSRISFSFPQLAAASVALIALSSMATWAGTGLGATADPAADPAASPVSFVTMDASMPPELAAEVVELQQVLEGAWTELDPNTVRVLERNLAVIEQAIDDSKRALELDPGNEFLSEHLGRVFERKLTYLRDAAQLTEWTG